MSLLETKEKSYSVTVIKESARIYYAVTPVQAKNEEEAQQKALELADTIDSREWDLDDESFNHSIDSISENED